MIDAENNRLDYGELLQAPEGYSLELAVATTYSLDLKALLVLPIALHFRNTFEGKLTGDELAILEAVRQTKDRIKVFYQAGNIQISGYNNNFALLESCLVPILPSNKIEFSSFHPKLWLLRFTPDDNKSSIKYRLIVLSRNLTFDRSWDIAVSLDGEVQEKLHTENNSLYDFITHLFNEKSLIDKDHEHNWDRFINELKYVKWETPDGFSSALSFCPGGPTFGKPLKAQKENDSIIVISPFIGDSGNNIHALNELAELCPKGPRYLFSSEEELNKIGEDKLEKWPNCFSIRQNIVEGEDFIDNDSDKKRFKHNLHAKIILTEKQGIDGKTTYWHLGSANATSAALGSENNKPRNTEFMLHLQSSKPQASIEALVSSLKYDKDNNPNGLFDKHSFQELPEYESDTLVLQLRKLRASLLKDECQWNCEVEQNDNNTLTLTLTNKFNDDHHFDIKAGLLAKGSYMPLATSIVWKGLTLNEISAFITMKIFVSGTDEEVDNFIIQTKLILPESIDREKYILSQAINTKERFLSYIHLLLQRDPDKTTWLGYEQKYNNSQTVLSDFFDNSSLFEQLMDAAAYHPEMLQRISNLLQQVEGMDIQYPEGFYELWQSFKSLTE